MNNLSNKKCHFISTLLLNILQVLLSGMSFMTLMSKRKLEKIPRTWVVWLFDVSKQVVGGILIQLVNLGISIFIFNSYNNMHMWSFINFFIDNTLGVIIVSVSHHLLSKLCIYYYGESSSCAKIGYYGKPPNYKIWFQQLIPYLLSLIFNKLITLGILYEHYSLLFNLENKIFSSFQTYPTFDQIIIIMICPWILMTFQLWIFDFILQDKHSKSENIEETQTIINKSETTFLSSEISSNSNTNNSCVKLLANEETSDSETQITI